jgi:hypothetical protein
MGFTTHFGLHSQATRLHGSSNRNKGRRMGLAPAMGDGPPQGDFDCLNAPERLA